MLDDLLPPEMAQPVLQLSLDQVIDFREFSALKMINQKEDAAFYRSMIAFSQDMPIG